MFGNIIFNTSNWSKVAKNILGLLRALISSMCNLLRVKWFNSPDLSNFFVSLSVSCTIEKLKLLSWVLKRASLTTRSGSSIKASDVWRKILFWRSIWPSKGSITLLFLSIAIELIVRSLRLRSSSRVISFEKLTSKPVVVFFSDLAKVYSCLLCGCIKTGKLAVFYKTIC